MQSEKPSTMKKVVKLEKGDNSYREFQRRGRTG